MENTNNKVLIDDETENFIQRMDYNDTPDYENDPFVRFDHLHYYRSNHQIDYESDDGDHNYDPMGYDDF